MPYRVEHGPLGAREIVPDLQPSEAMARYTQLANAGAANIRIFDSDGERVDPHTLRLAIQGNR